MDLYVAARHGLLVGFCYIIRVSGSCGISWIINGNINHGNKPAYSVSWVTNRVAPEIHQNPVLSKAVCSVSARMDPWQLAMTGK